MKIGQEIYIIENWGTGNVLKDDFLSPCIRKYSARNIFCSSPYCTRCRGTGKWKVEHQISCYKIVKKKILDIKASGSVMTDYDPGFDGGSWGDYAEARETWKPKSQIFLTKEDAIKAAKKIDRYEFNYIMQLWKTNPDRVREIAKAQKHD